MNPWKLVLLGFVRHIVGIFGAWLIAHNIIDEATYKGWAESATASLVGYILVGLAFVWSALDKKKVIEWLRKALRMNGAAYSDDEAARKISPLVKGVLIVMLAAPFVAACGSSGMNSRDRIVNDGKSALYLSAKLYDYSMTATGDLYRAGKCSEDCKTLALKIADTYLSAARPMKEILDAGGTNFHAYYAELYVAVQKLLDLVRGAGGTSRPNTLPHPSTFDALVAPQSGALTPVLGGNHAN